jgi:cysteine-S-conjugate beta-lyase
VSNDRHQHDDTRAVHAGRHPERADGAVNPPVIRASTIIAPTLADWESRGRSLAAGEPGTYYGRFGTATHHALEEALTELEAGFRTRLLPSGMAACAAAILSCVQTGEHVLLPDSVYFPVRQLAGSLLRRFGVEHTFYDPCVGAGIEALIASNTRAVYVEAPGSISFEMQDVPAIAQAAHRRGALVLMDNTWATPFYFKPLAHGVDISIQAATKYIVGHSDAMLGYATTTAEAWPALHRTVMDLGYSVGPDDVYLAQRGLRTLPVRLARHFQTGLLLAEWFARQPEVVRVLHPARPGDPGHALWRRDFSGASGLFGVLLRPMPRAALAALIDSLELFALGASWGGYESLLVPWTPKRSVVPWTHDGPCLRVHAGLEAVDDLSADLERGFAAMRAAAR